MEAAFEIALEVELAELAGNGFRHNLASFDQGDGESAEPFLWVRRMEHLADHGDLVRIKLRFHAQVNPVGTHSEEQLPSRGTARAETRLHGAQAAVEEQLC